MVSDNDNERGFGEGEIESVLFEAISHPTRIKMLFAVEKGPLGFSDLKRRVGVSSSGNLQHHIGKLTTLLHTNSSGDYALSDQGREAIVAIRSVRNIQNRHRNDAKIVTFVTTIAFYISQLNLPFILGTVEQFTPLFVLTSSLIFAAIFYPLYSRVYAWKMNQISETKAY
ncbi:MAG: winged helix-turn-helix domain-containing protein [Candidatus Thorarchaeota archaeon]